MTANSDNGLPPLLGRLRQNLGFIVITAGLAATVWIYYSGQSQASPEFVLGLVAALAGLLGILIQLSAARRQEAQRRIHELNLAHSQAMQELRLQSFQQRREAYEGLIEPFKNMILQKVRHPGGPEYQLDAAQIGELKFDLLTYASSRTLRAWHNFTSAGQQNGGLLAMLWMARMVLALRDDLGIDNAGLTETGVLRMFVNDIGTRETEMAKLSESTPWN